MQFLIDYPLIAFVIWTFLSVSFGLVLGAVIRHADAAEQSKQDDPTTAVLDWNNAPAEWRA